MKAVLRAIARTMMWLAASLVLLPGIAAAAEPRIFDLQLRNGALTEERKSIRVSDGDQVEIRWSSDRPVELHLHGYDIKLKVVPDALAAMSFEAFATGRFPISIHGAGDHHKPVLYLEVYPR